MSVVVCVRKGGQSVIAADNYHGGNGVIARSMCNKLFGGDHYGGWIGHVGDGVWVNAVEHVLPEILGHGYEFASVRQVFEVALRIRKELRDQCHLSDKAAGEEEQFARTENCFMFLSMKTGKAYIVGSNLCVEEVVDYFAIGSGAEPALGACHALYGRDFGAGEIAVAGVEAAAATINTCALPVVVQQKTIAEAFMRPEVASFVKERA